MINFRLGMFIAAALPLISIVACNSSNPPNSGDPTDPTPIIGCGIHLCPDPLPTPQPTVCPLVAGSDGCGPIPIEPIGPEPIFPNPNPTFTPVGPGLGPIESSGGSSGTLGSSLGQGTKDTSLQAATYQQNLMDAQAQNLVNRFAMSVTAARQLAQLANRIQAMSALGQGQLTDADRAAVTQSALGIAGLSSDQVNTAISQNMQGNSAPMEAVLETAAQNLGMSSSVTLRDQLLPALGLSLN